MLAPSVDLLRAGIGLKLNQIRRATRSYLRDRANQATGTVSSYAVAAGLFAAAGLLLIAACLVGLAALFRWVEIKYGMFWAFGAVGTLLVVIAAACGGLAAGKLRQPPPQFPSLASRLRVAIKTSPLKPEPLETISQTAGASVQKPTAATAGPARRSALPPSRPFVIDRNVQAGLAAAAILLGWAATRRRQRTSQVDG